MTRIAWRSDVGVHADRQFYEEAPAAAKRRDVYATISGQRCPNRLVRLMVCGSTSCW
jgi:hypothetical protein